jgi:hypothetical protein
MEHLELRFRLSGQEMIYAEDARSLVRRSVDELPARLFWRLENGAPDTSFPTVRWGGGRGVIRLCALTESDAALVVQNARRIGQGLTRVQSFPVRIEIVEHQVALYPRSTFQRYSVFSLLPLNPAKPNGWRDASTEERTVLIERAIGNGLRRQAEATGISVPEALNISLPKGQRVEMTVAKVKRNPELHMPCVVQVDFVTNLHIRGLWSCGHVTSKTFGRIAPWRGQS